MKVKRTYNLSESTLRHVRERAGEYGVSQTQDGVVEKAVERLSEEERARQEAEAWIMAAQDADFVAEMAAVARALEDGPTGRSPRGSRPSGWRKGNGGVQPRDRRAVLRGQRAG